MRWMLILVCFIGATASLETQEKYTINEYGTYVVDSGVVKKVPIEQDLFFYKFWKNYAVFFCMEGEGTIIYNIENGAASDIFSGQYLYGPKILENGNYFTIFVYGYIYKFDPQDMSIAEKVFVGKLYEYPNTDSAEGDNVIYERLGNRTHRYTGKNNYIEVTYGPKVDIIKGPKHLAVTNDTRYNRYVIRVYSNNYGR